MKKEGNPMLSKLTGFFKKTFDNVGDFAKAKTG